MSMPSPETSEPIPGSPPTEESVAIARLRDAAISVAAATGDRFFSEVVRAVAELTQVDFAFVGLRDQCAEGPFIRTVAYREKGQEAANFQYFLRGTPCERVTGREFRHYRTELSAHFPEAGAQAMGVQGYAALPLVGSDGKAIGLLVVMSQGPLERPVWVEAVLRMFAERTISEIERLSTSQALRIAEASYRVVFEASEDPIFVHDWDTMQILAVNQKACDVFGYRRDEFMQLTLRNFCADDPPFTEHDAVAWIRKAREEGYAEFEWRRRHPSGSLHWDEVRLKAASIAGQRRILTFFREITSRKEADAALRASEAMYRAIFESSVDALALIRRDGTYVDVNPAAVALSGQDKSALVGRNIADNIQPALRGIDRRGFLEATFRDGFVQAEGTLAFDDGREVRIEARAVPVRDQQVDYALVIVRDVTLARRQQHDLAGSEARLRATIDAAQDCVITMDAAGRIIDFNPASVRCFGIEAELANRQIFTELLVHQASREVFWSEVDRVSGTLPGSPPGQRIEITCVHADGHHIPMELVVGVARAKDTSVLIAYLHDLTAHLAAESDRAALESQLRQAQKMEALGQLTGGIAHDFNNILTSAIGYVDLVREAGRQLDPELRRYLQRSRQAAKRAQDLVQQMLTYSRGTRGESRPTRIEALIGEVVSLLEATLPSSIHIDVDVHAQVPRVTLDPVHATQALMNLCINARDAMSGRGTLRVEVDLKHVADVHCSSCRQLVRGTHVVIEVADDGIGMDPATVERIFEPFFSTKPLGKGSGMGLATTHGIVHQFGGHIRVDSTPGAGTRFQLLLPPAEGPPGDERDGLWEADVPRPTKLTGSVLIVDDNLAVGEFMRDLLRSWGLEVTFKSRASSVPDEFARGIAWDLAIIDQTMPEISGLDLARTLLDSYPEFPIILYTGFSDTVDEQKVLAAGCRALLRKPIDVARMRALVEPLLRRSADVEIEGTDTARD